MSKFVQDMEPIAAPKHVKDDLDAPLEAHVHFQFRGGVSQLRWLQSQEKFHVVMCHWNPAASQQLPTVMISQIDVRSLLVDCVSAIIVCQVHGRGRCLGEPP